jgi:MFS superfamily sulfate permease-like transporter
VSLLYFNVDHVCEVIMDRARADAPKLVILDFSSSPNTDMQSAETLVLLVDELAAAGIQVQVVEARSSVRDRLRGSGMDTKTGAINRFTSVADAVEAFQKQSSS